MSKDLTILELSQDLMSMADMPKDQIKRAMDQNYLQMLVEQNPTLKKQDFIEFINKCQLTGADPRLNQIYLLVHNAWNSQKQTTEPKGTTVFAYQFFIQMAQKTGELEDFGVDTVADVYVDMSTGKERKSLTAHAWVKRKGQGKYNYKARFWEFAKTKKDGSLMMNWQASPYLMLEKCAVANVMRWAFPESLSGLYVADEIEKGSSTHQPSIKAPIVEIKQIEPPEPTDDRTEDDIKAEMIDFLNAQLPAWFERIGKDKLDMLDKVNGENDMVKIKYMYNWMTKL
jgi:phage recombination protein Bet